MEVWHDKIAIIRGRNAMGRENTIKVKNVNKINLRHQTINFICTFSQRI